MKGVKFKKEFRKQVISKFLKLRIQEPEISVNKFCKDYYPELNYKTVSNWYRQLKDIVGQENGMSENEINNKYGTEANELSMREKFKIILDTAKLSEDEFGEYCRQKGLYASDIERWKTECESALTEPHAESAVFTAIKDKNNEIRQLKQQIEKLKNTCMKQEKEIDKDLKTLAIYAAKVTTLKNFHQLFTDKEED